MVDNNREAIKEFRKRLGLTQEALARTLWVSVMTVRRWESGKSKPSKLAIQALTILENKQKYARRKHKAGVVKQENTTDLKSVGRNPLKVQALPSAPQNTLNKDVLSEIKDLVKKVENK